jgi:hypothetical protein
MQLLECIREHFPKVPSMVTPLPIPTRNPAWSARPSEHDALSFKNHNRREYEPLGRPNIGGLIANRRGDSPILRSTGARGGLARRALIGRFGDSATEPRSVPDR